MDAYQSSAELVVALLAAAVEVGAIAGKLRVPYAVALLLVALPLRTHGGLALVEAIEG